MMQYYRTEEVKTIKKVISEIFHLLTMCSSSLCMKRLQSTPAEPSAVALSFAGVLNRKRYVKNGAFSWDNIGRFIVNNTTVILVNKYSLLKRVKLRKKDLKTMITVRYDFVKVYNERTHRKEIIKL